MLPALVNPDAFANRVFRIPSWRAFAVISLANFGSLPAMRSATATARSFEEIAAIASSALPTVILPPAAMPKCVAGWRAARRDIGKGSLGRKRPSASASNAR